MPIYEYHCDKCGTDFEHLTLSQSNGEDVACRRCGSARVSRLLSAFAVHGSAAESAPAEPGGCGACGAPRRGMCES
jgi:putative FmdB family regulatory protein